MMRKALCVPLLIVFLLLLESCCQRSLTCCSMKTIFDALTSFHYHFRDSSVPPPYHRSYSINADSNGVQIVVLCYGDTLADQTYPSPDSALQRVGQALLNNKIRWHKEKKSDKSCVGGVGHTIKYTSAVDSTSFSAYRSVCGGDYEGELGGDLSQFLQDIAFLTPELDSLIKSTR